MGDYPLVQERVTQHMEETKKQLERLETCLDEFGESRSLIKDVAQATMGNAMAIFHSFFEDEVIKNTFANYAVEHFAIAAYKSLLLLSAEARV